MCVTRPRNNAGIPYISGPKTVIAMNIEAQRGELSRVMPSQARTTFAIYVVVICVRMRPFYGPGSGVPAGTQISLCFRLNSDYE